MPAIDLRPGFCVFVIVLAALDRGGSMLPVLGAMALHELAHILAMLALGGRIRGMTLRFVDLRIAAVGLSYRQELLAALAGPAMNLLCAVALSRQQPEFAAYSLILGGYNLLPVWPLDGGRAVQCALLEHLPPTQAERCADTIGAAVCGVLLLAGVWLCLIKRIGMWPLGMAAYLLLRLLLLGKRERSA